MAHLLLPPFEQPHRLSLSLSLHVFPVNLDFFLFSTASQKVVLSVRVKHINVCAEALRKAFLWNYKKVYSSKVRKRFLSFTS